MTTPSITVTGADCSTDVGLLASLDAEIGLLFTTSADGRTRYPSARWITSAARRLPRVAIHICGSGARNLLFNCQLDGLVANAQRIQINGVISCNDCEAACALYPSKTIITQHKPDNWHLLHVEAPNHALLVDASGGRGLSPVCWTRPKTEKAVGFAGGLGPDNLFLQVDTIACIASGAWWVDMEGKLRVNDVFSVDLARHAVGMFHEWKRDHG